MNTITIHIEIEDEKLLNTLYETINVETEATKTERGEAKISKSESELEVEIIANDYIAARAITNSILRLVRESIDVVDSITIRKSDK